VSEKLDSILPPVKISVPGAEATIIEVLKSTTVRGEKIYFVTVDIKVDDDPPRRVNLEVSSGSELFSKIVLEAHKVKMLKSLGIRV